VSKSKSNSLCSYYGPRVPRAGERSYLLDAPGGFDRRYHHTLTCVRYDGLTADETTQQYNKAHPT
jgi:hypothetical protein